MERYRRRLIILAILIIILAIVAFLLIRRGDRAVISTGGDFDFITSIYGLQTPLGVETDDEEAIWISNTGTQEILRYDRDAILQSGIDTNDQDGNKLVFFGPAGITIDEAHDKVYINDLQWHGIRVLDRGGEFLYNLPRDPKDVPLDPVGNPKGWATYDCAVYGDRVYVASRDGIYVFDSDGNYIEHWGSFGAGNDQFQYPNGIATDPNNGNIYVTDSGNFRVVALTPEGKVRWLLGIPQDDPNTSVFGLPKGIAVAPDGRVFVTDTFAHKVRIFDSDGKMISEFGERGTADAQFNFPEGIAITPSYRMYLVDRQNNRLQIWQLSDNTPNIDPQTITKFNQALTVVTP